MHTSLNVCLNILRCDVVYTEYTVWLNLKAKLQRKPTLALINIRSKPSGKTE